MAKLSQNDLLRSLPFSIRGWEKQGDDARYDSESLFNYINGGAELYLTYDFREAYVRRYVKAGNPDEEIVLDIYDMGSSEEAFGIFTAEREDEDIGIGRDSELGGGLLRFWKGRYFVSMVVLGDPEEAKEAMMEIGRSVAESIPDEGDRPALILTLPKNGLIQKEIRYLHAPQPLNNQYYIASENILNLGRETDCLFAAYNRENENGFLLRIDYQDERSAKEAYGSFVRNYLPEAVDSGFAKMENGKWTKAKTENNIVLIVFEAPTVEWADKLLSEVQQ